MDTMRNKVRAEGTDWYGPAMICEEHPWRAFLHDGCEGPGMEARQVLRLLAAGQSFTEANRVAAGGQVAYLREG